MKKSKPKRFWIYYNSFKIGDGFCVEEFGRHVNAKDYTYSELRPNNILQIVTRGVCHLTVKNGTTTEKCVLKAGDAFLVKSGVEHTYVSDTEFPCTRVWIAFTGFDVENIFKLLDIKGGYGIFSGLNAKDIELKFNELYNNMSVSGIAKLNVLSVAYSIFAAVAATVGVSSEKNTDGTKAIVSKNFIKNVTAYIDDHINDGLSVEGLAKHFNYETSYFYKIFKQHIGVSVQEYVISRRIHFARELCVETDIPFTEIAHNLGYTNYAAFYKAFVKIVGSSPQIYRKTYRKTDK